MPLLLMIVLIAFLTAFVGGVIGQALACHTRSRQALAFIVPVCISTGLLSLAILIDAIQSGTALTWLSIRGDWQTVGMWSLIQCSMVLVSMAVTGAGWFCSWCVRAVFE